DVIRALTRDTTGFNLPPGISYDVIRSLHSKLPVSWPGRWPPWRRPLEFAARCPRCEIFDEKKYRRTYDSEFTAPLVAHYTWPALVQGSEVVARGEACTRRGAATSSYIFKHPVSRLKEHGVLLEISDQDLARLPGGWSPVSQPENLALPATPPQRQPQRPPKAGLAHIMQTRVHPLLSIMDKSSLSSSCYAIHLPPPSAAAAVAPGGPGTAYCWNAAAAAHPGCTYGGYGSFQQQPVMMPHQCQHQLHQLQQQQQQQPYCGNVNWHCGIHGGPAHPAADPSTMGLSRGCSCHDLQHHHHKQEPPQHSRTQHVYESYNSEERDNDEDTACYHDAQSRLRPSRQQLLNSSRPTGASAAGHHEAADVDPCGELLSTRRRRTSSSSRMNRDEHSLQHHHYRTSASNCRPAGNSTSAAETPEQYGGTRRHLATRRHNVEAASGVTRCSSPPHYRDHRSHPHHLHQHHHRLSANDELGDRAAFCCCRRRADADEPTPTSAFLHYGKVSSKKA
uniref:Mitochondria-eating protein n=1 Tax=Macrostomum lignano TaxID=282301 RepID=A0A1I8F4H8_9PLAT